MPRTIELAVPSERTAKVVRQVEGMDGVASIAVLTGASHKPPGDLVRLTTSNDAARTVLTMVEGMDLLDQGGSVTTSELRSVATNSEAERLHGESSETIWEEVTYLLRRETNPSYNFLTLMALAGAIAAAGLWSDGLHLVIGAMVIAPGFEPFLRVPLALVARQRPIGVRGLRSIGAGYLALALGAALATLVLRAVTGDLPDDLATRTLVDYWSTLTPTGLVVAVVASAAGAMTITAQRSVMSAGVMIALALVPSISIAAMALVLGQFDLAARGLGRWAWDAAAVLVMSLAVMAIKQQLVHRRRSLA